MKKEEVYNKIVEELMVAPDKLEKFLDAFGTMSSWFLFKNLESLQNDHNHQTANATIIACDSAPRGYTPHTTGALVLRAQHVGTYNKATPKI